MFKRTQVMSAVLTVVGGAIALPAVAQSDRIEVTGSRIRQIETETAQPILRVSQEDIQKSGLVTLGDIVNTLTTAGTPAFSKGSVLTSNREQGGQYADMRNLGAQRVLVLVNGKRWSQTVAGYTDMSTIPSALIERIEILKDGASAIYGSDAIAGVVNVILKKSLTGGQVSLYAGRNEKGDGKASDYSLVYGANGDKASVMLGVTFNKVDPVWARTREITNYTYGPDHKDGNLGTSPWGRIRQVSATGGATGFNNILNHTGSYDGVGVGQDSSNPASYHPYAGALADVYNASQDMMFQMGSQLSTLFAKGTLELTPSMRLSTTAMFASRSSTRQIAGYPVSSTSQAAYPVYIDKDNYYNPYGNRVAGAGNGKDLFFYRRTIELPRVTTNDNSTTHLDASLDGDLALGATNWNWSVGANYSSVRGTVTTSGNLNLINLKKALGPSFMSAAGVVTCGTPAAPIGGCVPFDIVGGPSASTAAALGYVNSVGQGTYGSTVSSLTADITGEVFKLPAGAVGLAAGYEERTVRGYDRPGQFEQSGMSTDLAANTTIGNYKAKEMYGEVSVPILKGVPGAAWLSIDLAMRHSDYSTYGTTDRSKYSLQYKPVKDLLVRGTVAQGFRAPTLNDISGGGSQTFDNYLDPCDSAFGEAAKTADVAARCAAAGVPAGFRQKNQAGNNVPAAGGQTPFPFQAGAGNPTLKPETATTKTLGFVFSPSFASGLNVSLDWWKISIYNRITAVSAAYILNQCYVQNNAPFCTLFSRDATGQVNKLARGNANLGELSTEGYDIGFNYAFPATSFGRFGLRSETTYLKSYRVKSTTTGNWTDYAAEYPYYRVKSNLGIDWSMGSFSATLGTRYYARFKSQCWDTNVECSNPGEQASWGSDVDYKSARIYNDLSVGYKTPWKGELRVGANNVFNVKPRIVYDANSGLGGNSSTSSVDPELPLDRFLYVRYVQAF